MGLGGRFRERAAFLAGRAFLGRRRAADRKTKNLNLVGGKCVSVCLCWKT